MFFHKYSKPTNFLTFRLHYKECLVELINNNALDPVVLLDGTELRAEMNRWKVPVPDKQPLEPDQRYEDRLRQVSAYWISIIHVTMQ